MGSTTADIPFDLLLCIMEHVVDRKTLCACTRVSRLFHEAALPSLYKSVRVYVCRFHKLDFDYGPFKILNQHPHLKPFVKTVEICLGLNDYVKNRDHLTPLWETLSSLPNITSFSFWPPEDFYYHLPQLLTETIATALERCDKLEDITLLSTISASSVKRLSELGSVRSVRLGHLLSVETVGALGGWFGRVGREGGVRGLSVMKAHSVNSTAIKELVPYISNLHTLHIGTNHSLTSKDLLALFTYTPQIRFLDITYYGFLAVPLPLLSQTPSPQDPLLPTLDVLVIRHSGLTHPAAFASLFGWIKLLITSSPLTSFSIFSDDGRECEFSDDEFLGMLGTKKGMLEVLNIPSVPVRRGEDLRGIFEAFGRGLRVVSVLVGGVEVFDFYKSLPPTHLGSSLTTLYLRAKRTDIPGLSYDALAGRVKQAMGALRGPGRGDGYVHFPERGKREKLLYALWTAGPMTDRVGLNLLKDEYPGMYKPFN
ncbi:hypothetical protein PQX77_021553 [Marasmius sp. AFHP31]|nr:hypothetical protein PQX77_021553 [Marasmius sp. AFHP31]